MNNLFRMSTVCVFTVSIMMNLFAYAPDLFALDRESAVGFIPASMPVKSSNGDLGFKKVLREAELVSKGYSK